MLKNTIAGAVDLGVSFDEYATLSATDSTNTADWIVVENGDGIAFIPKSAPTNAKTATNYTSNATDNEKTCGVYYRAADNDKSAPTVKVFVKGC